MINFANTKDKHFEFTKAKHPEYPQLKQVRATRDIQFGRIRKGEVGGWITCVDNLEGEGWVAKNAVVLGDKARIKNYALATDNARIMGTSLLSGHAVVSDRVSLSHCIVSDYATVRWDVSAESSRFYGSSGVYGMGYLGIMDSIFTGHAYVKAHGQIKKQSVIGGSAIVSGKAEFSGAALTSSAHYMTVGPLGSEGCTAVIYRSLDKEGNASHTVKIGCWDGRIEELAAEVEKRQINEWASESNTDRDRWEAQYTALEALVRVTVKEW